jgi:hypothetical protein
MGAVLTENVRTIEGVRTVIEGTFALDSSYPTGGEAVTAASLGLVRIDDVIAMPRNGYVFQWDAANSKLLAYHGDSDGIADGPGVQVPDTTNLATVTGIRARITGV